MTWSRIRIPVLLLVYIIFFGHTWLWHSLGFEKVGHLGFGEFFGTLQSGIVTAGTIFSIVVFLHALFFGGLFCGWMCHWGILQDIIAWVMEKCGIKPRMVTIQSRLIPWLWFLIVLGQVGMTWATLGFPTSLSLQIAATPVWTGVPRSILLIFLTSIISGALLIYLFGERAFCRTICTFRLWFSWFERVSPYKVRRLDACKTCARECSTSCPMGIDVEGEAKHLGEIRSTECIKCMVCVDACPVQVLKPTWKAVVPPSGTPYVAPPAEIAGQPVFFASLVSAAVLCLLAVKIGGNVSMSLGFVLGFLGLRLWQQRSMAAFEWFVLPLLAIGLWFRTDFNDPISALKGAALFVGFLGICRLVPFPAWREWVARLGSAPVSKPLIAVAAVLALVVGGQQISLAWAEAQREAARRSGDWKAYGCFLETTFSSLPDPGQALRNLAKARLLSGDEAGARKALEESLDRQFHPESVVELSTLLRKIDAIGAATDLVSRGLASYPTNPAILLEQTYLDLLADRIGSAEANVVRALTHDPANGPAHLLLAEVHIGSGRLEEAEIELKLTASHSPELGYSALGRYLIGRGRFPEAADSLLRATAIASQNPALFFDLGVAYAEQGNLEKAIMAWETVSRLDPTQNIAKANIERAKERLRAGIVDSLLNAPTPAVSSTSVGGTDPAFTGTPAATGTAPASAP